MATTTEQDPTPDPTPAPAPHPTPGAAAGRSRAPWLIAGFVLVGLLLRLPLMNDSIWFDEACMSSQRIGTLEQLLATIYVDIHPPLYIAFMHFWNGLFGDSEWSMRIPPLLAGLLSIPMLFLCGRRLVGPTAALWAAALLTLSPAHIWYSVEARLYAPLVLCALLAVYTFDRILVDREKGRLLWLLHIANLAVMLALHYYLALYVVLLAAMAPLVARGFSRNALRLLCWHGAGIMALAGFVFVKQQLGEFETSQDYLQTMTPQAMYELLFVWCWTGHTLQTLEVHRALEVWVPQGLGLLLAGLGLVHVLRNQRRRRLGVYVPVLMLAIPGFLAASAWAGLDQTYIERSCLPTLAFFLLLIGGGIAALPRRLGMAIGGLAILLTMTSLATMYWQREAHWTVYKPNPDWRAAATWLGHEIDAGATGRPVFTSMPNPRPLPYYDARIQDVKTLMPPTSPEAIAKKVERHLGSYFGRLAGDTFTRFAAHNQSLLEASKLRVYRSSANIDELELSTRMPPGDDVCYLVRNEWHPHKDIDHSIEDLLGNERVTMLEHRQFQGMSVYKVRIAR